MSSTHTAKKALAEESCEACRADAPRLADEDIRELHQDLPEWQVIKRDGIPLLTRDYAFKDFFDALAFTNLVGRLAESVNHHPSLLVEWGKVRVEWWTHKIKGLHKNDFVMAAKTDRIFLSTSSPEGKT
jgi:4a-hydroxytetrahydrobiopterin dehydratase